MACGREEGAWQRTQTKKVTLRHHASDLPAVNLHDGSEWGDTMHRIQSFKENSVVKISCTETTV